MSFWCLREDTRHGGRNFAENRVPLYNISYESAGERWLVLYTNAAFTQWIGGSESKSCSHSSPPSRPIQSWPVVLPR